MLNQPVQPIQTGPTAGQFADKRPIFLGCAPGSKQLRTRPLMQASLGGQIQIQVHRLCWARQKKGVTLS